MAVLQFSGTAGDSRLRGKVRELRAALHRDGLTGIGQYRVALYNPPWTPPFMRRNKINSSTSRHSSKARIPKRTGDRSTGRMVSDACRLHKGGILVSKIPPFIHRLSMFYLRLLPLPPAPCVRFPLIK